MSDLQIPHEFTLFHNGEDWYSLSHTMAWLKDSDNPIQVNPYKRRCSKPNIKQIKIDGAKGKPKIYVNMEGLKEIVERTRSIGLNTKKLLGITSGVTSNEKIFEDLLSGFCFEMGLSVQTQYRVENYSVDYLVGGVLAVEYDEITHISYCSKREKIREGRIKSNGFDLLRVSDSENIGASLARIVKKAKKLTKIKLDK